MSSDVLLEAENLTAIFSKSANQLQTTDIRHILDVILHRPATAKDVENGLEFKAVNDISLTIRAGESLGVVGINGSGKSTLFRLLAGFLEPNEGRVIRNCKIQAMINLSAGFMPELSGLENIRLAATLFGVESKNFRHFEEEVIDFADIGDFIMSPIKNYSSGMKARIGYAVSALIGADLLLIDEVLAVGDAQFQNKCRAHIETLKRQGTSIALVSHSNTHIMQLCDNSLWLDKGTLMASGHTKMVLEQYQNYIDLISQKTEDQSGAPKKARDLELYGPIFARKDPLKNADITLNGETPDTEMSVQSGEQLVFEFDFEFERAIQNPNFTVNLYREDGLLISGYNSLNSTIFGQSGDAGRHKIRLTIPHLSLVPGVYMVVIPIQEGQAYLQREVFCKLHVGKTRVLNFGLLLDDHVYEPF